MITQEQILKALSTVEDPDLKQDLVTLGMVSNISVNGNKISFTVTLTTPACPLKEVIRKNCFDAIKNLVSAEAEVDIIMDAKVTTLRDRENILPGVKNIIAVASGKGGVGKSTVAVNLALGLSRSGSKVGIVDADIYGPSIPIMLNIKGMRPMVHEHEGKHYMVPIETYNIKALSIGLVVEEQQAVVWRGPMVSSALRQFMTDAEWGELDYLIVDLPPGTGDIHLTLVQLVPLTGAIIVTTPQDVALADARKALGMFSISPIDVPVLGIVENMAYFTPEELPDNKYYIFGKGGGRKLAEEYNVPFLGEVPIVQSIREGGDRGQPAVTRDQSFEGKKFLELANEVARQVAIRNAHLPKSKVVEMIR
ncbi:MAG TPA: MRP family ATP-binding protein [Bacteroidetes bacterium]|nr:MRP family ATP-binding protein [Bacteroidota bacterium]